MKNMKKLLALLLAVVLCLGMTTVAMAADTTYTLSIKTISGHTYKVYQLATGDVSADGKTLSNIARGANAATSTTVENITDLVGMSGTDLGNAALALVDTETMPTGTVIGDGTTKTVTLSGGYYVVVDSFTTEGTEATEQDKLSPVMVEIVKDTTMTPKATGTPTDDKKIDEGDGVTASGKYSVGDDVPFVLTATMPSSIAVYETYKLEFVDTLSSGLTLNENSIQVFVGDTLIANPTEEGATPVYTVATTTTGFTVSFADVKVAPISAGEGTVIKVKYTAKLNENAENTNVETNESHINYSNDPKSNATGETTNKKVKVHDFELRINKVEPDGQNTKPLAGAGFTLYRVEGEGDSETETEVEAISAGDTTTFEFKNLSVGKYRIKETTTPDGYNTIQPIDFEIIATYDADGNVESLKAVDAKGGEIENFEAETTTKVIATDIVNSKGTNLPSTGGIGTTIFYVIGGILVVGAGVLLITKKRMSHNG